MKRPEVSVQDLRDFERDIKKDLRDLMNVVRQAIGIKPRPAGPCQMIPFPSEKSGHDTSRGDRCVIYSFYAPYGRALI
jgi:hypothetical protein